MITSSPTSWRTVLLLCGKCARKIDGGFGPRRKDTLRTALRDAMRAQGRRREIRVIETRCMGVCPKKAITALNATRPDRLMVVRKGTDMELVVQALVDGAEES